MSIRKDLNFIFSDSPILPLLIFSVSLCSKLLFIPSFLRVSVFKILYKAILWHM